MHKEGKGRDILLVFAMRRERVKWGFVKRKGRIVRLFWGCRERENRRKDVVRSKSPREKFRGMVLVSKRMTVTHRHRHSHRYTSFVVFEIL